MVVEIGLFVGLRADKWVLGGLRKGEELEKEEDDMDPEITSALIMAIGAIIAAGVGALIKRNSNGWLWAIGGAIVVLALAGVVVIIFPHLATPAPTSSVTITNTGWNPYVENNGGSSVTILKPVTGTDNAIEVSFSLLADDWVTIYKKLPPQSLSGMKSVRIAYRGTGASNTIELKLIDKHETIFVCELPGATNTAGQVVYQDVSFDECLCRVGTGKCAGTLGCAGSPILNPKHIDRIDFGFSNGPIRDDEPGSGTVVIDEILILP